MNRKDIYVGMWGFIMGSRGIEQSCWNKSFPQNWFGKIIEIKGRKVTFRCYREKRKGNKRHPHLTTELKFISPTLG